MNDSTWLRPFVPRRGMRNGDVQTLMANFLPRRLQLPPAESVVVEVDAATGCRVLCHCNWQPENVRASRMTLLVVHGLEGSSQSQYMLGNADKALRAGWNVIRMNMRNCAGTEALCATLYHSGLSGDVRAVAEFFVAQHGLTQMAWVGYSMGGNLVLRGAGEYGENPPTWLRAVIGVSPVVDMAPSADALHAPRNRIYEVNFLRNMLRRYRRKAKLFPGQFSVADCGKVRSIRSYDEYIVAPNCGFTGANDYYEQCAAARVIGRIRVPTLILHSQDDPFIRLLPETRARILANPNITLVETQHGGHCGFLASVQHPNGNRMNDCNRPNDEHRNDGYWAESTLMDFIQLAAQSAPQQSTPQQSTPQPPCTGHSHGS